MRRLITSLAALLLLASPTAALSQANPTFVKHPSIIQVICDRGFGTAFAIGPGRFISVEHVTRNAGCTINGQALVAEFSDEEADFSVVTTAATAPGLKISCEGFKKNEFVYAIGFARGQPKQQLIVLRASGMEVGGDLDMLFGPYTVIGGMSGGPVLNARGEVVGTVNAYMMGTNMSFSRSLKSTHLCGA